MSDQQRVPLSEEELERRLRLVFDGLEDPISANVAADEIRAEIAQLREAAGIVIDNHEAILATKPAGGTPLVVAHWIAIDRLKAALGGGSKFDAESAAAGLEQVMLVRLGKANQKADRLRELLRTWAGHTQACPYLQVGYLHRCTCGWDAVERELAGEGEEA